MFLKWEFSQMLINSHPKSHYILKNGIPNQVIDQSFRLVNMRTFYFSAQDGCYTKNCHLDRSGEVSC